MLHKKISQPSDKEVRAGIRTELAKPRMAKSARIALVDLASTRFAAIHVSHRRDTSTGEHGHEVKLKKAAHVSVASKNK